ncbi:MAG: hypothetical protein ACRD9S_19220 [Pyrinomonadaceae bacterium]
MAAVDPEIQATIDVAIDAQIKIVSASYEQQKAYTNLVIVAGYAGLFALWQFNREHIGRRIGLSAALLLLLSMSIFVIAEIYRAHFVGKLLRRYYQAIQTARAASPSLEAINAALVNFDQWQRNESAKSASWWIFVFWATTLTGVAAAMLLLVSFIHALFLG